MWVAVVSLLPTGAVDWPSRRPRALWSGSADQAARLSETAVAFAGAGRASTETVVAFAGAGRASTETVIAFAGEKRAFLVRFSGAEVMSVSRLPCSGACSGDGGFMLACISGCRGVIGCKVKSCGVV